MSVKLRKAGCGIRSSVNNFEVSSFTTLDQSSATNLTKASRYQKSQIYKDKLAADFCRQKLTDATRNSSFIFNDCEFNLF